jgi:predicted Zn-dependent protease
MGDRMKRVAGWMIGWVAVVAVMPLVGCKGTNILSKNEEIRLGREVAEEVEKEYVVSRNPADNAMIESMGQRIVAANQLNWPFTFKILEDRQVNAFSLPGGPVYVFRGLIDLSEGDEDEIACVLAHEIAHITRRHAAKQYSQGVLADIAILIGTQGTMQDIAQIASVFVSMRYSRDMEYEADTEGIRYAYRAGYDPNGLIRFFSKLQRLEKEGQGDIITNNLRSHPMTGARIERAKKEIQRITQEVTAEMEAQYAARNR